MSNVEENKKLIEEFPFLMPRNRFTDKIPENFDYSYTELDDMPDGWRNSFGLEMCKEIKEALLKVNKLEEYRITQIKEKYGTLRWYSNFYTDEIDQIIRKYEKKSETTCILCGKEATHITLGWISPFCIDCLKERNIEGYITIEEYLKDIEEDNDESEE